MKISKDEYGNKVITYEVGDGFIFEGRAVTVIEVDEDIMDVKIRYADDGSSKWIKESQLDDCEVLPKQRH